MWDGQDAHVAVHRGEARGEACPRPRSVALAAVTDAFGVDRERQEAHRVPAGVLRRHSCREGRGRGVHVRTRVPRHDRP